MKEINVKNKTMGTRLQLRIFKNGVTFFVLPRKHSKHWIPITTTKEEAKEIRSAFLEA